MAHLEREENSFLAATDLVKKSRAFRNGKQQLETTNIAIHDPAPSIPLI